MRTITRGDSLIWRLWRSMKTLKHLKQTTTVLRIGDCKCLQSRCKSCQPPLIMTGCGLENLILQMTLTGGNFIAGQLPSSHNYGTREG
jgi:hypothetical protein